MSSEEKQTALVGWSVHSNDPEILEAARKNRKSAMGCAWVLLILFPLGFLLAGLLVDEMPLNEAIIIGVTLGVVIFAVQIGEGRSKLRRFTGDNRITLVYAQE